MEKTIALLMIVFLLGISYPPESKAGAITARSITVSWINSIENCDGLTLTDFSHTEACISTIEADVNNNCVTATGETHMFLNLTPDTKYFINVNQLDTSGNNSKTCKLVTTADLTARTLKDTMPPKHSGCVLASQ